MENINTSLVPFFFGQEQLRAFADDDGKYWFVAQDLCEILEIQNPSDTVRKCLDEDERADIDNIYLSSNGVRQTRKMLIISESGLYALVFRSRKPRARAFSRWVRCEVLPALRKSGRYALPGFSPQENGPEAGADWLDRPVRIPAASLRLRPVMRERLLASAIQTARLAGRVDMDYIDSVYARYCGMVAGQISEEECCGPRRQVADYIAARLESEPGARLSASRLYDDFCAWWKLNCSGHAPTQKFFGSILQHHYTRQKKAGRYFYYNCAFAG